MAIGSVGVAVAVYGFALWLGLYLIERDPHSPRLRLTGLGLVAFAAALACDLLVAASPMRASLLARLCWPPLTLPALCWTGAMIHLLPEETAPRERLARLWRFGVPPTIACLVAIALGTDLVVNGRGEPATGAGAVLVGGGVLLPLLALSGMVWQAVRGRPLRQVGGMLATFTLFFALSTALLLLPFDLVPRRWALLLVGIDLIGLGLAIARFDAFDLGEALWPDLVRAFDAALLAALLVGGQVLLVILVTDGLTRPLLALLLATVGSAIAVATFAGRIGTALDHLALRRMPTLRAARAELRATAAALPRADPAFDLTALDEVEFTRLTRRALSRFGDLPHLAASPLINLPLVGCRLAARNAPDDALERATELKAVLAESIARLKPRGDADFGTTDEWRHYNALFFPYVVGLKPYRRRGDAAPNDRAVRDALAWFRTDVPERTLYNWQTAAARLVAHDLRTRDGACRPESSDHRQSQAIGTVWHPFS